VNNLSFFPLQTDRKSFGATGLKPGVERTGTPGMAGYPPS
jgi:hypothetical protein